MLMQEYHMRRFGVQESIVFALRNLSLNDLEIVQGQINTMLKKPNTTIQETVDGIALKDTDYSQPIKPTDP